MALNIPGWNFDQLDSKMDSMAAKYLKRKERSDRAAL
jgi:hypothetical protein